LKEKLQIKQKLHIILISQVAPTPLFKPKMSRKKQPGKPGCFTRE